MNKCIIFVVVIVSVFSGCDSQKTNLIDRLLSDTTIYKIDTFYNNVNIDGEQFSIKILRDKYDEHLYKFDTITQQNCVTPPFTMVVIDKAGKVVYFKKFNEDCLNTSYSIFKSHRKKLSTTGKLYFAIFENGCGSGTYGPEYLIEYKVNDEYKPGGPSFEKILEKVHSDSTPIKQNEKYMRKDIMLTELFHQNELDVEYYNKDDNQILVTEGNWGDGESHFEHHKQHLVLYSYYNGAYQKVELGTTNLKYGDIFDEKPEETLKKIHDKEPRIFKSINIYDFLN